MIDPSTSVFVAAELLKDYKNISINNASISNLPFENGITYLWRVKSVNNGHEEIPSEVFSFSTLLDNSNLTTLSTESGGYEQVEFEISLSGIEGKDINISIISPFMIRHYYIIVQIKNL